MTGASHEAAGGGLMNVLDIPHAKSVVSSEYISKQAPQQSPYQLLEAVPGAVVSSSDPYGLTSNEDIAVRGLDNAEMGFLWEGMPINDIGTDVIYPSQMADNENLSQVSLQQGGADIDAPLISAAGGVVEITLKDPKNTPGVVVDASYGSYRMTREFIRLDTGLIGHTGLKAFVSFSDTHDKAWRGPGNDDRRHIDAKLVKEWGTNRIAISGEYNTNVLTVYPLETKQQWAQYGQSYYYDPTYTAGDSNYWQLNRNPFRQLTLSAPSRFALADRLTYNVTPFFWKGYGNATTGAELSTAGNYLGAQAQSAPLLLPYQTNGSAETLLAFEGDQFFGGLNQNLSYHLGHQDLTFGYYYLYGDDYDTEPFTPVGYNGQSTNIWGTTSNIRFANGTLLLDEDIHTRTQINFLYLQDELTLLDNRLHLTAGFKEAMVDRNGTNGLPGTQYRTTTNDAEPLPQLAARFNIDRVNQVFANVSTNFRAPLETNLYNSYNYDGSLYLLGNSHAKSEYVISEEVGYRLQTALLLASATFFNYNYTNRQITSTALDQGLQVATNINAGGQTVRGLDFEAATRKFWNFRPHVAVEYLHSTIDNDISVGTDVLPTAGKTAIRSPKFTASFSLDYDIGAFFASAVVQHTGSMYSTFMNDEQIPGYTTGNLNLGVRLPKVLKRVTPEVQLNLVNITNTKYLAGVASVATNAKTEIGKFGTTVAGTSPTYYVGAGFAAVVTAKATF